MARLKLAEGVDSKILGGLICDAEEAYRTGDAGLSEIEAQIEACFEQTDYDGRPIAFKFHYDTVIDDKEQGGPSATINIVIPHLGAGYDLKELAKECLGGIVFGGCAG